MRLARVAIAVPVGATALVLAGCAGSLSGVRSEGRYQSDAGLGLSAGRGKVPVKVYFYRGGRLVPVDRRVDRDKLPRAAVEALFAGPTPEELKKGFRTTIPRGVKVVWIQVDPGTATAKINLTRDYAKLPDWLDGKSVSVRDYKTSQLVYTLVSLPRVRDVLVMQEGDTVPFRGAGVLSIGLPIDRALVGESLVGVRSSPRDCEIMPQIPAGGPTTLSVAAPDEHQAVRDGLVRYEGSTTGLAGDVTLRLFDGARLLWSKRLADCAGRFTGWVRIPPTLYGPLTFVVAATPPGARDDVFSVERTIVVG